MFVDTSGVLLKGLEIIKIYFLTIKNILANKYSKTKIQIYGVNLTDNFILEILSKVYQIKNKILILHSIYSIQQQNLYSQGHLSLKKAKNFD